MSENLTFLAVFGGIILIVLVLLLFRNKRHDAAISRSTCGDILYPGGTDEPLAVFSGPVLDKSQGGNKSPGMPLHPTGRLDGSMFFDMPTKPGTKLDYVTFRHGPLSGREALHLDIEVEADPDVKLYAVSEGVDPSITTWPLYLTPYFQREGDNWTAGGKYETYRWYATRQNLLLLPGRHKLVVPFKDVWTALATSTYESNPQGFSDAIDNSCCVGFVLGGNENGWGHGGRATGKARLIIHKMRVS